MGNFIVSRNLENVVTSREKSAFCFNVTYRYDCSKTSSVRFLFLSFSCAYSTCLITHSKLFHRLKRSNQSEGFSLAPRPRRQANGGFTETLCPTRSMYVMPQAALNNQGSWKYVVNLGDKPTQFVQSEVCV